MAPPGARMVVWAVPGRATLATLAMVTLRSVALVPVSTKGGLAATWVTWTKRSTTFRRAVALAARLAVTSGAMGTMVAVRS